MTNASPRAGRPGSPTAPLLRLRTLSPTPVPRTGPRKQRGRSKARAPVARKRCVLAQERGALISYCVGVGSGAAAFGRSTRRSHT
ncbi:hypothetical protein C1H21_17425 [Xanthomonas arboricola pv. juglandis]|nr:hypothetical protein C1H21_17425 [Xanthomonas arboricola pv. juglandis]